ncbi:MAG: DUF6152 family protein [Gammaproteobacteria bacterium]
MTQESISATRTNRWLALLLMFTGFGAIPSAWSHHSFSEFDQQRTIEVSGTVTDVAWQNPHVRLKVQSQENGKLVTWDIECHSVGILSRSNVNPKLLKAGDRVKIAGNPSKVSATRMFATNLLPSSGEELVLAPGAPPHWQTGAAGFRAASTDASAAPAPGAGIFQVWSSSFDDPAASPFALWSGPMPLTPAAKKALAAWDPVHQTVAHGCDPKGMPTIMEQPYGMQFENHGSTIVLRIEEYDTVRTIHISDGASAPSTKSLLGHSVGKWEGATLVVTTTGISWPYIAPSGLPQGPSSKMVERFIPSGDGKRLDYSVTITDPQTFTEPAVLKRAWVWRPTERVQHYACGSRRKIDEK